MEIALAGVSRASEIRAAKILALRTSWRRRFLDFGRRRRTLLAVETVEGEDVHLEATSARVVKGRRVKIGPECRIESVEYAESLQIDPQAVVGRYSCSAPAAAVAPVSSRPVGRPEGWVSPAPSDEAGRRTERPLGAETFLRGLQVQIGGREIHDPLVKVAGLAAVFPAVAVLLALLLFILLPAIGIVVCLLIAGAIVAVVVATIAIPVFLALALAVKLALVPIRWFMRRLENRPLHALL